jgi:aryl-alcohol dehydrogenase-like predicted oxidoreductase
MQFRKLGKRGPEVSAIGFGGWPIGGGMGAVDERTAIKTVHQAIDRGMSLVDTAEGYRTSETIIGKALKGGYRDRCFLATKVSNDFSKKGVEKAIENSLRALDVEYVDLYQVHAWDSGVPIEETMEVMVRLQKEGKVRYIGVSNFRVEHLKKTLQITSVASNQINYNLFLRTPEQELFPFCRKHGIGIMVHSPLAKGILAGKYTKTHRFAVDDERSQFSQYQGDIFLQYLEAVEDLKQLAAGKGVSIIELALAWVLRVSEVSCALVGIKNPDQLDAPLAAADVELTKKEAKKIDELLGKYKLENLAPFKAQIV